MMGTRRKVRADCEEYQKQRCCYEGLSDHGGYEPAFDRGQDRHTECLHQHAALKLFDQAAHNGSRSAANDPSQADSNSDAVDCEAWTHWRRSIKSSRYGDEPLRKHAEVEDQKQRAEDDEWLGESLSDGLQDYYSEDHAKGHAVHPSVLRRDDLASRLAVISSTTSSDLALVSLRLADTNNQYDAHQNRTGLLCQTPVSRACHGTAADQEPEEPPMYAAVPRKAW